MNIATKTRKTPFRLACLGAVMAFLTAGSAEAFLFTGTSGNLSATADFTQSGSNLVVTLSNIGGDVLAPADILTTIFFDLGGVGALTPVSALLGSGSTVLFDPQGQPAGGVVGGEWAYGSGLAGAPLGATEGIASSGFGLFGSANFPGPDLDPPTAVNGFNYGLTSAADNIATGNAQVTGSVPLIQSSVVFTLSGLPANFVLASGSITNVSFQYGTALTEPNVPGTTGTPGTTGQPTPAPEPSSLALLGLGLIASVFALRRRSLQGRPSLQA